ncbi:MAG: hypothetical protein KDD02_08220 [Phaeodactylibacter sp.]|nr:hypothetical protein [Phaeodactylibacter sp.]
MKKLRSFSGHYPQSRNGASATTLMLAPATFNATLYQLRQQARAAARRTRLWWKRPRRFMEQESSPATEEEED